MFFLMAASLATGWVPGQWILNLQPLIHDVAQRRDEADATGPFGLSAMRVGSPSGSGCTSTRLPTALAPPSGCWLRNVIAWPSMSVFISIGQLNLPAFVVQREHLLGLVAPDPSGREQGSGFAEFTGDGAPPNERQAGVFLASLGETLTQSSHRQGRGVCHMPLSPARAGISQ